MHTCSTRAIIFLLHAWVSTAMYHRFSSPSQSSNFSPWSSVWIPYQSWMGALQCLWIGINKENICSHVWVRTAMHFFTSWKISLSVFISSPIRYSWMGALHANRRNHFNHRINKVQLLHGRVPFIMHAWVPATTLNHGRFQVYCYFISISRGAAAGLSSQCILS